MQNPPLENLPLEWVRAFEAAARTGSFTEAAAETGITQSAISQRIANLEARLGAQLFHRQPRRVVLTVAGETWLPYVSAVLRSLGESARAAAERAKAAGACQHSMGICNGEPSRFEAIRSLGESSGAAPERVQRVGSCQHGMGICNGEPSR